MTGNTSKPRCRVLLVLATLGGGGAERVIVTLSQHLSRNRFEVHLAVASAEGPLLAELPPDVVLHDLKASRVRYCIPALFRLIWRLRPTSILSTSVHVNVPLLAMRSLLPRGTKIFVRENSMPSAEFQAKGGMPQAKWLYRWFYSGASAVVCQSDAMLDELCGQFSVPRRKLVRIYNPLDCDRIRTLAAERPTPFTGGGPHLVASGRLVHAKGFDILLDAMAEVRRSIPSVHLSILGSGELNQDLHDQCTRLGLNEAISFVGFLNNPFAYYLNADLFVLASRYEGLPNAMLEAMALNTPVVATECAGGVREILQGSPNFVLCPPEDAASLAKAILACLLNKRSSAGGSNSCFNQTKLPYAIGAYEKVLLS